MSTPESSTAEYSAWSDMKMRCYNPNHSNFRHYGGRSIAVCPAWLESFDAFLGDMGRKPSPKHSLDRIDNEGMYEPGNCRWATHKQQQNNKTNNRRVTYRGRSMTLAEALAAGGSLISHQLANRRISFDGWSVEDAVETPRVRPPVKRSKEPKPCRECHEAFYPTLHQIRTNYLLCSVCRRKKDRILRERGYVRPHLRRVASRPTTPPGGDDGQG